MPAERMPFRDVIVITAAPGEDALELFEGIVKGKPNALVVMLAPGQSLQTLTDEDMRAAGWVRLGRRPTETIVGEDGPEMVTPL